MAAPSSKYDNYDFPTTAPVANAGHPGHTTPEQDAKVEQLRSELEQLGYTERLDTLTLLRFLRARKFDVALAKTMYVRGVSYYFSFAATPPKRSDEQCPISDLILRLVSCPRSSNAKYSANICPFSLGSSSAKSGGRSSALTTCLALSTTKRSRKCSSSTLSTTTRRIRYNHRACVVPSRL